MEKKIGRTVRTVAVLICVLFVLGLAQSMAGIDPIPFGFLDVAADANGNTTIPNSGSVLVSGWAGDPQDFAPVARVEILIDGNHVANATLGLSRPDVAAVYGAAYQLSGWSATIPLAKYAPGTHTVSAIAYNSAGFSATLTHVKTITVTAPDLSASNLSTTGTLTPGKYFQVTDTTSNIGAAPAGVSFTRYYLNKTAVRGGTVLGGHQVIALATGASAATTISVLLPSTAGGDNFLLACANDSGIVLDGNSSNNCTSIKLTLPSPDLAESVTTVPTTLFSGTPIAVADSVTNFGTGSATWSYTRYFLNSAATRGGTLLGSRYVAPLASGATSTANTNLNIPTVEGSYFLVACANDTGTVPDGNYSNNCVASPVTIYKTEKSVVVDPAHVADPYDAASCGTANAACMTIADGIAATNATRTVVLVYPGTYVEQVLINKNITLVSVEKNQAVIQAPADKKLVADKDGLQILVTIDGGVTSATVKDFKVAGPMVADSCADNFYGIFAKNANATIAGNTVDSIRQANSALWGCQPGVAIRFGARYLGYIGHRGTISDNVISGPAKGGIVVDGDNTAVQVLRNNVTGLNVVGIIGQNGIQISRGAMGTVDGNTITGFRYGDTFSNLSAAGILLYDANPLTVSNNVVSGNDEGIGIYHSPKYLTDGTPDYSTQYTTGAIIKKNTFSNNQYLGIHVDPFSKGNTIWTNTALENAGGWDELDEHPDFNSNNWGSDPTQVNNVGTTHAGLVFSY